MAAKVTSSLIVKILINKGADPNTIDRVSFNI